MPNNNVAILSLMAKFDDRSIEEAANKLGKTTEEALSNVGQDKFGQTIVNEFNKAMDTVKKKLKGVNLSSYTSNVLDSLFSDKDIQEKTKDLDKFIKNITNLSRSLSGLNPNSLNSMNTKQLDAVIAKQEKILEKEQEIANKKKELEGSASNIANQKRTVQTISKNYLVSDYRKSNESLKKLLATGNDFDKNQEKSIEHLSKMLTLYSDMAKIEPAKGTTDTIRYNKDLLTIVREINKETSKIDAFTSGKASSFLSKNFKSMDTVNDYEVNRSQQDFVKNGLRNLNAQKSKLEKDLTTYITNTVQKNLQKTSNETEKVIDKAIKKANTLQAKIEEVRKNENSSNKPVIDNIIDESQVKSLDEIESRLYEIFDKDADGDATNKDLKEFITLYKQYEQLISQQSEYKFNPDFKEEYEYIVDSSSAMKKYADNIQMISAEQKKMVANNDSDSSENIKQLLEQGQQLEKVTTAEKKLSDVQEESVETFRQDLEKVREQINDISSKLLSLQDNSFSSLTEQVNNVTNAVSVLNDKLQSVYELVDKLNDKKLNWSELQFHQGNLEDIKNTRSRDDFGDMVSGLLYGGYLTRGYGYGVGGTGLYTARNIDEFSDFGKKANGTQSIFGYAIDWSKYPDAFKPETIESAIKIHEFLSNLQAFCIKLGSGFDKFDEKLGDINTQKLYSDYQSIFKNAKLDFEEFSNFINEMSNLVKTAGTVDEDHFSSISEELSTSDNISARFMKKNGYSGINVSGFKEFDNVDIGSVLYDIRDGAIVKRFETLYDLMNFANQQTEEINKIAEAKKNNQSLNSGEIKSEINEIKNEIIELNKTKEQLLNEINEIQSNFTNKTNISSGDSSTTSTIDKQLSSTKKLIDEEEKLSNIQNKIISFKPQNNDAVINEKTEETLQKSSEYASKLLETAQQIVRLANNNVGFISSEDATEIEKLYQLFPELRDFRYNDMSLDFMSKSDLDEGWMDAFMDFSATLPKASEYFEMINEFSSHLSDDGRFWGNKQDFAKDFLHVDQDALDRIAEVNNALNEALGTEENYTSKYKEVGQQLKDGSIDIQDAIRNILQLEFPNNKIMETPDGVWVAPEKLNKTTKSIKDVSSAVSDVSNKVLQFPDRNVISEQDKIQEELQQTQDEIDSTQSKYQSLLDVAKKQLDDDKSLNYYSGKTTETKAFDNFIFNEQAKRNGYFDVWSNDYKELITLMDKTEEELKSGSIGFDEAIDRMVAAYQKYDTATKIDVGGFDFLDGVENVPSVLSDIEKAVLNENKAIKESEYTLQDYINTYLELKKVKESSLSVDSKITGVTSNGRPIIKDGSDESFKAELMMKDMESEVLQIYGKDLSALADEHIKASESAKEHAKAENQVTQAIKESSATDSTDQKKDAFPDSSTDTKPEIQGMDQVEKATEEAVQAKKDFATANEGVQSSINGSENPLKLEAELMKQIAKSAREAADAKKEFVEANKQVKDSANDSNSENKKKDKYAKHNKISEDDFLNSSNKYSSIVDKQLNSSNYVILGKTVNTELVNGLVKVTAKIKDANGVWKSFSAKVDADGNIFEQRFKTITKNVDKLESELEKAKLKTNDLDNNTSSNSHSNKNFSYSFDEKGSQDYWNGRFKETVSSIGRCNDELARMNQYYKDIEKEQENLNSQFNKMYSGIDKYNNKLSELNKRNISDSSDDFIQRLQNYRNALTSYQNELDRLHDNPDLINKDAVDNLKRLKNNMDDILDSFRGLEKGSKSISRNTLIYNISDYMSKNTNMSKEFRKELEKLISELRSMGANADVKDIADQFFQVKQQIKEAGQEGKRFLDIILDKAKYGLAAQIGMYFGFNDIIRYIGDGITVVREFDTALTEMKKVSNETEQSLKNYQATTFDTADAVGTTAKQIQNSTADWMRLGESMSQAAESAKDANILLNVSEFDGIDEATESLVSMSQAYKDLDKMDIIDVLNNIGNNYSISTDGLATALKDSASALVTANNDLNEAVALTTSGNAITQDPSKVGAGLRTISLRLVGTEQAKQELSDLGEETDGMLTTVSKLRDTIMDATKAASKDGKGFDILDDNGNYKSTYEIMQGLADLYDDIVKKDKELGTNNLNLILETIAGKNRSNIAASILQNGDMLRSVYEDAQNSEGSATEELNKYLDSIDGKIAQLQNRAQEFWTKVIDSEAIKNGIDLLTTLVKGATDFVDKVGTLPTLLTAIGAALSFKNVGGNKMHFPMNILDSTHNLLWIQRFRMC